MRLINHTVTNFAGPPYSHRLFKENTPSKFGGCIFQIRPVTFIYFWNENSIVCLFLDIYDIFDEVLNIEKHIHVRVSFSHSQKFISLNHKQFVFGYQVNKNTHLTWIRSLNSCNCFFWVHYGIVYILLVDTECAPLYSFQR